MLGSIGVGDTETTFFLWTGPLYVVWSSGISCRSRIILRQYFWKTLSFASSTLRISITVSKCWLNFVYASSAHPPYLRWPSLVRVHFASNSFEADPVRGILAPAIYKGNVLMHELMDEFSENDFNLPLFPCLSLKISSHLSRQLSYTMRPKASLVAVHRTQSFPSLSFTLSVGKS